MSLSTARSLRARKWILNQVQNDDVYMSCRTCPGIQNNKITETPIERAIGIAARSVFQLLDRFALENGF